MCGLFGLVRSTEGTHQEPASWVFVDLGRLAERRGRDAAGFALVQPRLPVAVFKATRPFGDFWLPHHGRLLHQARVALGHTRHASQGAPGRLANAHPLEVGSLAGTVNGDIDADDLRDRLPGGLPAPQGETDSEVLLLALDRVRGDLGAVCEVLAAVRGPAALAWFHRLDKRAGGRLGFQAERVPEGSVLVIATDTAVPTVVAERSFTPTARAGDEQRLSIWAGLDPHEVALFQAEARHRIAPVPGATYIPDHPRTWSPPPPDPRHSATTKGPANAPTPRTPRLHGPGHRQYRPHAGRLRPQRRLDALTRHDIPTCGTCTPRHYVTKQEERMTDQQIQQTVRQESVDLLLYRSNRRDGAYVRSGAQIAEAFVNSPFYRTFQAGWPLDRALRAFITAPEPDGLNSTFEEDGYPAVFDAILDHIRSLDRGRGSAKEDDR